MVAQGALFYKLYRTEAFIDNNLMAADLFGSLRKNKQKIRCLAKALDGYIILDNKLKADSLIDICNKVIEIYPEGYELLANQILSYVIAFGSDKEISNLLRELDYTNLSDEAKIDIANGYYKIGENKVALDYLNTIDTRSGVAESLKYLLVKSDILESVGDYFGALDAYKDYSHELEISHEKIFSQDLLFAEDKHTLEMLTLNEIREKDKIVWISICCFVALVAIIIWIYYHYRLSQAKRIMAEKEKRELKVERDNLNQENKKLDFEKRSTEIELGQQALITESLRLRIYDLESESANLKMLLFNQKELSIPVENTIRERIEMLNALLAKEISENDTYAKPYGKWIDRIVQDKAKFMDSTRLAFKASHPKFMEYLEEHGLTEFEINYLCLYAIGLRGKEVGEYIQLKRHYNISSDIRKKLGINEHETNIGIYIRKLMKKL